jgi:hypothetical protein
MFACSFSFSLLASVARTAVVLTATLGVGSKSLNPAAVITLGTSPFLTRNVLPLLNLDDNVPFSPR